MKIVMMIVLFAATATAVENATTVSSAVARKPPGWAWSWMKSYWNMPVPVDVPATTSQTCASADCQADAVPPIANQNALPTKPTTQLELWEDLRCRLKDFGTRIYNLFFKTIDLPVDAGDAFTGVVSSHLCIVRNYTQGADEAAPYARWGSYLIWTVILLILPFMLSVYILLKGFYHVYLAWSKFRNVVIEGRRNHAPYPSDLTNEEKDILCRRFMKYWLRKRDDAAEFFDNRKELETLLPWVEDVLHKHFQISGFKMTIPPALRSALREYLADKDPTINGVRVYRRSLAAEVARHSLSDHKFQGVLDYVIQATSEDLKPDETS